MLFLSSDHLHPSTKAWLALVRGLPPAQGGASLLTVVIGTADPGSSVPQDLRDCLRHARLGRHELVQFVDSAAAVAEDLPVYDQAAAKGEAEAENLGDGLPAVERCHPHG